MSRSNALKKSGWVVLGSLIAAPSLAASPWLPFVGQWTVEFSQIHDDTDQFFRAEEDRDLPADLTLDTSQLSINYGISDTLAADVTVGYANSEFDQAPDAERNGSIDSRVGLTWQFINEFDNDRGLPTTALRVGAIIEGDYDVGAINSIGDGGSGYELTLASGKNITETVAISGELGIRDRDNDIPRENILALHAAFSPVPGLTTFASYINENSIGGISIGQPGFSESRFPELEEDKEYIQFGAQYSVIPQLKASLTFADVIDGKNTSDSDIIALGVGYSFE